MGTSRTRRINPASIGITFSEKYEKKEPKHNAEGVERTLEDGDKRYYVKNIIRWILKKVLSRGLVFSANTQRNTLTSRQGEEQPPKQSIPLYQYIPASCEGTYEITIPLYSCDHDCEDGYPLSYYKARSQGRHNPNVKAATIVANLSEDCGLWVEVKFDIDMSKIGTRLQPKSVKSRKSRRKKMDRGPIPPSRRSARLNGTNGTAGPISGQPIDVDAIDGGIYAGSISPQNESEQTISPAITEIPEDAADEPQQYFRVDYTFTVEFVGLLAKYRFWCKDAEYENEGNIDLPNRFQFGS